MLRFGVLVTCSRAPNPKPLLHPGTDRSASGMAMPDQECRPLFVP